MEGSPPSEWLAKSLEQRLAFDGKIEVRTVSIRTDAEKFRTPV
jgi:hypothetical protein